LAASRLVLGAGLVLAVVYPIVLQLGGYPFYQTIGFLVLLNAMLGIGWNVIGGWTGQFDFGPQVFFAVGRLRGGPPLHSRGAEPVARHARWPCSWPCSSARW
jgi:hypothetical protein